jgi:hypothetical protein
MMQRTPLQGAARRADEQATRPDAGTARKQAAPPAGRPGGGPAASLASRRARGLVAGAANGAQRLTIPGESQVRVTARGALVGMFALCLAGSLLGYLLHLEVLIGIGFCAACVLAPAYVVRPALLEVVSAPPVTFLLAVVVVQALTAQGDSSHASMLSVLEGTLVTLAAVAPWLLAGTVLCLVIAMRRGLPECVRDLRAGLRGEAGVGGRRG